MQGANGVVRMERRGEEDDERGKRIKGMRIKVEASGVSEWAYRIVSKQIIDTRNTIMWYA